MTHERVMWHGETAGSVHLPTLIIMSSRWILVSESTCFVPGTHVIFPVVLAFQSHGTSVLIMCSGADWPRVCIIKCIKKVSRGSHYSPFKECLWALHQNNCCAPDYLNGLLIQHHGSCNQSLFQQYIEQPSYNPYSNRALINLPLCRPTLMLEASDNESSASAFLDFNLHEHFEWYYTLLIQSNVLDKQLHGIGVSVAQLIFQETLQCMQDKYFLFVDFGGVTYMCVW